MAIPGSNLLRQANKLIRFQTIQYRRSAGRVQNEVKQWVSAFNPSFDLKASVQMVPRAHYTQFGLDFQRSYVKVFAPINIVDLERDSTGDQLVWGGRTYQLESQNTWFLQDGWASCLAVDIGKAEIFSQGMVINPNVIMM